MKKYLSIILALLLIVSAVALVSCNGKKNDGADNNTGIGTTYVSDFGFFKLNIPNSYTLYLDGSGDIRTKTYVNTADGSAIVITVEEFKKGEDQTESQALHYCIPDDTTEAFKLINGSGAKNESVPMLGHDRVKLTWQSEIPGLPELYETLLIINLHVSGDTYAKVSVAIGEGSSSRTIANYITNQFN